MKKINKPTIERIYFLILSITLVVLAVINQPTEVVVKTMDPPLEKQNVVEVETVEITVPEGGEEWVLTAYCPCPYCSCQSPDGLPHTACGEVAQANHTVAASSVYPFGTVIYIEGMGYYTVEDRFGSEVDPYRADIFFNTHEEACEFGRQVRRVVVVEEVN